MLLKAPPLSIHNRDVRIFEIRHACEHTRSQARSLNPLARVFFIGRGADFLLRQCCAPLRSSLAGNATALLAARSGSKSDTRLIYDRHVRRGQAPPLTLLVGPTPRKADAD